MSDVEAADNYPLILSWMMTILTSKLFMAYFVLTFALDVHQWLATQPLFQKNEEHKKRDKKFLAFQRMDLHKTSQSWSIHFWALTAILRFVIFYTSWTLLMIVCWFFSFFKNDKVNFSGKGYQIIRWMQQMTALSGLYAVGIFGREVKYLQVDYSKYLGPDWKADPSKKPVGLVSNHQSWLDIVVNMYLQSPSHVAKESNKRIPVIGKFGTLVGCLWLKRDSGDSKGEMFTKILERQKLIEQGSYPPLIFFAEGGTSNGRQLLQFKKGGFFTLKSVMPQIISYDSPDFDYETCVIKLTAVSCRMFAASPLVSRKVTVKRLPVFEPNDYFFANFQKEGEEKWQTYARVIRDIMAEHGNLNKSDLQIEDKFEYIKQLYPSRKNKSAD